MPGRTELARAPAPRKLKLTPEAMLELDWFVARTGQMLADTLLTFQRTEAGPRLFYGLDFEIIYAYANPWSREASQARIVRYLIEQDRTPFVLLPGTVEELKAFVEQANRKKLESQRMLEILRTRGATSATISTARQLCASAGLHEMAHSLGPKAFSRNVSLHQLAQAAIQAANRYVLALRRINQLLRSERYRELQEVFLDNPEEYFLEDHVPILADRMYRYRQSREKNLPDAKNLAVIAHHGNLESRRLSRNPSEYLKTGVMLRLLTNTSCMFHIDIMDNVYSDHFLQKMVKTDISTRNEIHHSFAVRNCPEAAMAAAIQQQVEEEKPSECRRLAFGYKHSVFRLRDLLTQIDNEARNYRFQGDYDTLRLGRALDEFSSLLESDPTAEFLRDPWYSTVKYLLQEYESECADKERQGQLPSTFEPIEVGPLYLSANISSDIRRSPLEKIQVLSGTDVQSFLDTCDMDIASHEVKVGGEGLKTFVVASPELPEGLYAAKIHRSADTWYAEWSSSLSVQEALALIRSIFAKEGTRLDQVEYDGGLFLNICDATEDYEPVLEKLCALPLDGTFPMAEYGDLVKLLSEIRNVSELEPIDIRCDTTICHLRIDVAPVSGSPGILFAFRDTKFLPLLIEVFQKTSPFGGSTPCIERIKQTVPKRERKGGSSDAPTQ